MPDGVYVTLEGSVEMQKRLLAMAEAAGESIIVPIAAEVAEVVRADASSRAPQRTGALKRGIHTRYLRSGRGYVKFDVYVDPAVYYGLFQEYGLGTGSSSAPSSRTASRRANYEQTKRLQQRGITSKSGGLSKGQRKRLETLEQGGRLQGQRRPNMAAQPFFRPAIRENKERLVRYMLEAVAAQVLVAAEST